MSTATYDISWDAPEGFHIYRNSWDPEAWIETVLSEITTDPKSPEALRSNLQDFIARTEANPQAPIHVVGIEADAVGRLRTHAMGQIILGEMVDVEEIAEGWRASIGTDAAGSFDVVVRPSRKSPAAAGREVYKSRNSNGEVVYREWGSAIRNDKSLGLSLIFELVTSDLSAFDDMAEFLLEATEAMSIEVSELENA